MTLAGLVRSRDRLMGIGQAITMPLFFASNALYPIDVMPSWLHVLSTINPLSYEVHALRALLIGTPFNPLNIVVLVVARNRYCVNTIAMSGCLAREGQPPERPVSYRAPFEFHAQPSSRRGHEAADSQSLSLSPRRGLIVSQPRPHTPRL
jgi:hypothetical protein